MGNFDWGLLAGIALIFWGSYRLQSLGMVNPQQAHRPWIALAIPAGAVLALALSYQAWQQESMTLAVTTLVGGALAGVVLFIIKRAPIPLYFVGIAGGAALYLWRLGII